MSFHSLYGFNILFSLVPIIIILVFIFVFGTIIIRAVKGTKQWHKNNSSPVLTVAATIVTKRTDVHYYHHNNASNNLYNASSSTTYYVTFEVTSGDRIEFKIDDKEYGMLVEHDTGMLTFQGTRYLGFERNLK